MAVQRNFNGMTMKVVSNYGEVAGKTVRKSKSYAGVKQAATNDAIMATYTAITGMQQPLAENCLVVTTEELINA
jgi:hypothetical protein